MTDENNNPTPQEGVKPIAFRAETRQLLDILIHSLYTEREIFLRELISNASDALTRVDFEILTNRQVLNPELELVIRVRSDPEKHQIFVEDTGIGMTAEEMIENLGTIAHSGARDFIKAAQESGKSPGERRNLTDLIGQFGVGFYSAFMVADWIRVTSRSHLPDSQAAEWYCDGSDTFTVEPAERSERGTTITIQLKEDAVDFARSFQLREIIRRHSDFIPFPIFLNDETEQVNRQTALWRQSPRQVSAEDYHEFYRQLTLETDPPLAHAHMVVDAPAQMYALLFIPGKSERSLLSQRKQDGLKLYARKVLIQEYNRDLLPEYLGFIQGVVDSEDLPLNVSRESVQANRVMAQLKKLVTSKVLDTLKKLAEEEPEKYRQFWEGFGRYLKQGIALDPDDPQPIFPLLRFHTHLHPDTWTSLDDYIGRMQPGQEHIYYLVGQDEHSLRFSPHLDQVRKHNYEVLLLSEPVDPFMLVRLSRYQDKNLVNIASAKLQLPETEEEKESPPPPIPEADFASLVEHFKTHLGEKVSDVRLTDRLSDSPARLVDPEGTPNSEMARVLRLLNQKVETPPKVLELNPRHAILRRLNTLTSDHPLLPLVIEQIFEDALLIEGLHPEPASMIQRIQRLMESALE